MQIEQWLKTELGQKIWNNKYRYNNESLDEWFDRVSGGDDKLKKLIQEQKFLFGGRTLSNRGLNDGSYSNCFVPGTRVLTEFGYKNIEDIKIGERVLTKDNTYQLVNRTFENYYEGEIIVFNSPNLIDTLKCTPNHKFLTNVGWISADEIESKACYQSPKNFKLRNSFNKIENEDVTIDLFSLLLPHCDNLVASVDKVWIARTDGKKLYDNAIVVNRYITIDAELKYVFGRYLGDGSITNNLTIDRENYIFQIVFNAEEEADSYIECKDILNKHFGNICSDNSNAEQNTAVIKINSSIVGEFFNLYCGKKENKHFPEEFKNDINIALGLLDSDGSVSKSGGIRIWLKVDKLMDDLYNCLLNNNLSIPKYIKGVNNKTYTINKLEISKGIGIHLMPLLTKTYSDGRMKNFLPRTKQFYEVKNNSVYFNIWDITRETYIGKVYNLSVENNHDYIANGVNVHNCYSNGYVEDNLPAIMKMNTDLALTYKAQGGQGLSLSKIRPKGTMIGGRYESDGIVPFMEMFNQTTDSLKQGGSRKGALMMSLDITHKEAETFITIKSDLNRINKANLSLEIDDAFMEIVDKSYKYKKEYPMDIKRTYGSSEVNYTIIPIKLYKLLIQQAWKTAEPGVLFVDKFRNRNLMEFIDEYKIITCNPCGEQPLPAGSSCNLGSINLSAYVINPFTVRAYFDYNAFIEDVSTAVEALDKIIDENLPNHALPEQREMAYRYRNIGLGYMGLADAMIKLDITYGSKESISFIEEVGLTMLRAAIIKSSDLAVKLGSFPMYRPEVFDATMLKEVFSEATLDQLKNSGLRNCSLLSIAPTGSLGTMLNVSTGIEPNFAFDFTRKTESLESNIPTYHKVYAGIAAEYKELLPEKSLPKSFVTAHNIDWRDRIKMQSMAQKYVDTAISATINLPKDITIEEVEYLYLEAWKFGLKGVTIYRDGCREGILTLDSKEEKDDFFTRPQVIEAKVVHFLNDTTPWIAFIGMKDNRPFEIFSGPADIDTFPIPKTIKTGQIIKIKEEETRYDFRYIDAYGYQNTLGGLSRIFNKEYWNYARLISGMLRNQVNLASVVEIVENMHSDSKSLHSWKNGVIRALKTFIKDGTKTSDKCPECGQPMIFTGGCKQCSACGWSKC